MSFWFIILTSFVAASLVVPAVLLWVGINALLHQRRLMGEPAITIESLGPALRLIYEDTVRQSLPDDFRVLLGKLPSQGKLHRHFGALVYAP